MKRILIHFTIQAKDLHSVGIIRGRLSYIKETTLSEIIAAGDSSQEYVITDTYELRTSIKEPMVVWVHVYLPACLHHIADQIGSLFQPFGNVTITPLLGFYPQQT